MKPLILLLAAAACLPAGAAINATGKKFVNRPHFLPQDFTINKNTHLCLENDDEGDSPVTTFTIFDTTFNEINKFSTPAYPEVTAEYTAWEAINAPIGITATVFNEDWWGGTKEQFENECVSNGLVAEEHGTETWYISANEWDYFYFDIFGTKYPQIAYVWNNTDNKGLIRRFDYEYESWGPTGQYGNPKKYTDSTVPHPQYIYPYDAACVDNDDFTLSQTLFNKDDKFEWIVPIIEAVDCSETNEHEKVEGKRLYTTGFRVESQDGSVVATVKFPTGLYAYSYNYLEPYLYKMGEKNYLFIEVRTFNHSEQYYIVYEIDPSNASINAIDAPRRVSIDPTTPRRGTEVNVTLGTPAEVGCKVIVTSVSGQTVMTRNIEPGTTGTSIDTGRFEKGMYIVTVADGKTTRENAKIIVR